MKHRSEYQFSFFAQEMGKTWAFFFELLRLGANGHFCTRTIIRQTAQMVQRSAWICLMVSVGLGSALAIHFMMILGRYQATHLVGGLVTSTLVEDVSPFLLSFVLAGKIGAYRAAELASMRVTEQIDAIESLGESSMAYLIGPRWISTLLSSFLLNVICMSAAVLGACFTAKMSFQMSELEFMATIPRFFSLGGYCFSIVKAFLFALISATVSCFYGFYPKKGARGVGKAVTRAAVYTNIYMVVTNYLASEWIRIVRNV